MESRSNIGACLDGGFGWGLHKIWSSREGDAANGRNTSKGPPRDLPRDLPCSFSPSVGIQATSGQEPFQARDRAN
jgi:hypothetical protein